jgi:hypothetical protein
MSTPNWKEYLAGKPTEKGLSERTLSEEYLLLCKTLNIAPEDESEMKSGDIFRRLATRYHISPDCNISAFTSYARNANQATSYQRLFLEQKALESLYPELFGKEGKHPCEDENTPTIELFFKEFELLLRK